MPDWVMTGAECRAVDQLTMRKLDLSELQLMQRAADAALDCMLTSWPEARHICIYCGPGNNGGDGYLLAAGAKRLGFTISLYALGKPVSSAAQQARQAALATEIEILQLGDDIDVCVELDADLIVDALFGHGLARNVEAPLTGLFECINTLEIPVFSVDMPSGISSDSGAVMGIALKAEATLCFVAPKIGLLTGEGVDYAGSLHYHDLGIPTRIFTAVPASYRHIQAQNLDALLPRPGVSAHKGDFGHVSVIGGQPGMPGAVILAALAAARSGAGRVTAVTSKQHISVIPQVSPVLMSQAIGHKGELSWPLSTTALVLGPGLGTDSRIESAGLDRRWSQRVFESALSEAMAQMLMMVIDADGLNLLATQQQSYKHWILTPHPGEAAALLHCSITKIEADRPKACRRIAKQYGGICVLKGHGTIISDSGGQQVVCSLGNWGMATAGSGDVLSGIIGGLLGQGMALFEAACAGVLIHALAGDMAAQALSKRGLIASDIIDFLPEIFRDYE